MLAAPLLGKLLFPLTEPPLLYLVAAIAEAGVLASVWMIPRLGAHAAAGFALAACLYHVWIGPRPCGCFGALISASHGRYELLYAAAMGMLAVGYVWCMQRQASRPDQKIV